MQYMSAGHIFGDGGRTGGWAAKGCYAREAQLLRRGDEPCHGHSLDSAREGANSRRLAVLISGAVNYMQIPILTSTNFFTAQTVKYFKEIL
jgi:hypothetical protein